MNPSPLRRLLPFLTAIALLTWCASHVAAAPPAEASADEGSEALEPPAAGAEGEDNAPAEAIPDPRIEQLQQLAAGELDPDVDERALFAVPVEVAVGLAREVPAEEPGVDTPLVAAFRTWFARPEAERQSLLEAHAAKRAAKLESSADEQRRNEAIAGARTKAALLRGLLDGDLAPDADPSSALTVDLLDPFDAGDGLAADETELSQALEELNRVRALVASLTPAELQALLDAHAQSAADAESQEDEAPDVQAEMQRDIAEAETEAAEAARAQEAALEDARKAKSEVQRQISEEEARLQGLKQDFALFDAELSEQVAGVEAWHELAAEWTRRVRELQESPLYGSERAAAADPMYEELRGVLGDTREEFRTAINVVREGREVPEVGTKLAGRAAEAEPQDIKDLRAELETDRTALVKRARAESWKVTEGLRDDVVEMNRARLALLKLASASLRSRVTGFGRDGVDQVKREIDQITLELTFHALKLRTLQRDLGTRAREATVPLILGSLKFLFLAFGFWAWRKAAPGILTRGREWVAGSSNTPGRLRTSLSTVLWFLEQVRRPLEVLLALWVGLRFIGSLDELPELTLLWIVARWTLIGLAVILFVDAIAKREAQFSAVQLDTAALRISSLRLVGLSVIAVGLVLSLTSAMVGKGAIYSWVLSTCWLLAIPITGLLISRWRETVFERLAVQPDGNALTRWAASKRTGLASMPAAALGAGYLLAKGISAWTMRQLSGLESTRRLLAYLFRREVARQAATQRSADDLTAVPRTSLDAFDPEGAWNGVTSDATAQATADVLELAKAPRATLSAVVGERGAGKSTVLRAVPQATTDPIVVTCPESGFEGLRESIAQALNVPAAQVERVLRERGPTVVLIDDMQRIMVPAVGGLKGLDAFTQMARDAGGQVSWVAAFESAAWSYIRRARGERVFFEQVVSLPKWSEEQLSALIDARLTASEMSVDYEDLSMPRQTELPLPNQGDRSRAAYMRLLWDYSSGNPGATLDAFRRSLFQDADGNITVRLFREPDAEVVEALSLSILFVLRACVQLERASNAEIVAATQLEEAEVADAVRFCIARGYLEAEGSHVRLSWDWYRTISTVLVRQHLLPKL